MESEPRNAASEHIRASFVELGRLVELGAEGQRRFRAGTAEGFSREDRRRLVGSPPSAAEDVYDSMLAFWDLGSGPPVFLMAEVLAVRGERSVLYRSRVEFDDGESTESLVVDIRSPEMKCVRLVVFDLDDIEPAIDELDQLHSQLVADDA